MFKIEGIGDGASMSRSMPDNGWRGESCASGKKMIQKATNKLFERKLLKENFIL